MKLTRRSASVQLKFVHYGFDVRDSHSLNQETLSYYVSLLENGLPFKSNVFITEDGYIIDGRHRFEAHTVLASKIVREGQDMGDTYIPVDIAPGINWGKLSEEEKLELHRYAFGENAHTFGRPATYKDLEHLVGCHLDNHSEAEIVELLRKVAPVKLIRKAINTVNDRLYKVRLTAARQMAANGMSPSKAKKLNGIPETIDLEERNRKGQNDKTSTSKIKQEADKLAESWYKRSNRYRDQFVNGDISQERLASSAQAFIRAAERLNRMAQNIQERTNECIAKNAKRLTAVA